MKKLISTILGLTLITSAFATVNCIKNDNCAIDQINQEEENGITRNLKFGIELFLDLITDKSTNMPDAINFRLCYNNF